MKKRSALIGGGGKGGGGKGGFGNFLGKREKKTREGRGRKEREMWNEPRTTSKKEEISLKGKEGRATFHHPLHFRKLC